MQPFWQITLSLATSQTLIWGAVFYSFTKLLPTWEQETPWSLTEISAAFTIALLVGAACAPMVGRQIDRGRGAYVLAGGGLMGAAGLLALSQVTELWHFYAVYVGIGMAMSAALYDPCFAVLTKTMGDQTRRAITIVTLAAGFASTIAFPSIFILERMMGWRQTLWVLAVVVAFIAVPLQWYGARLAIKHAAPHTKVKKKELSVAVIGRNPIFWLLALAYATLAYNHSAIINHLLPLLDERGVTEESAVFAASMIGPMQVTGRVLMLVLEKRVSSLWMFVTCFVSVMIASVALLASQAYFPLVALFVIGQGAGHGVVSIMRPLITAQFMGNENYGIIAGWLSIFTGLAVATAPTIAAVIHGTSGGYTPVIMVGLVVVIIGLSGLFVAARVDNQQQTDEAPAV